jgi:hypothetical protein
MKPTGSKVNFGENPSSSGSMRRAESLKEEGFMGLTTLRSSASRAPRGLEGGEGDDLYEMFAVRADRLIRNPESLVYLKLRLEGVDPLNPYLNQSRQRMDGGLLEITKEVLPSKNVPLLPFHDVPEEALSFHGAGIQC